MVDSQIEEYLKELLLEKGSAVLPDFGLFMLKRKSAAFANNYATISPPTYELTFDERPGLEDPSLANYIALQSSENEKSISENISEYVRKIKERLQTDHKVTIHGIGKISQNEGNINFQADTRTQNWYSFGFSDINVTPLTGRYGGKEDFAVSSQTMVVEKNKPSNPYFFWLPLLLISALVIGLICQQTCRNSRLSQPIASVADDTLNQSAALPAQSIASDTIDEIIKSEIVDPDGVVRNADGTYTGKCIIIVGSFKKSKYILKMEEKLSTQGFNVYKENNDATTRVGFTFDCESKNLVDYIHKIRAEIDKGAWYLQPQLTIE